MAKDKSEGAIDFEKIIEEKDAEIKKLKEEIVKLKKSDVKAEFCEVEKDGQKKKKKKIKMKENTDLGWKVINKEA